MKPFFCRVGNKTPLVSKILKIIPPHKTYVEPFVGGGAIYFAKEPSVVEVINDLDKKLIQGYRLLKKINDNDLRRTYGMIEKVKLIKNEDDKVEVLRRIVNMKSSDDGLKLYQILLTMCNTFSATGTGNIYKPSTHFNKLNKISKYKDRLKKTKIFSMDYKNIINKFDANDTFFFLDPPYEKSSGLYKNSIIDYNEMNEILSNIKGKFLLTINSSAEIKNIFKNFNIKEIKVKGGSRNECDIGKGIRSELIITNY